MHLPLAVAAGALPSSSFRTGVRPRGPHTVPSTVEEVPGGFRLVKAKNTAQKRCKRKGLAAK